MRADLLNLNTEQLVEFLQGEPAYRARQIQRWIYRDLVANFDVMTNLPKTLRTRLSETAQIGSLRVVADKDSADGLTRKILFALDGGQTVETVLMLYPDAPGAPELEDPHPDPPPRAGEGRVGVRRTVCVSTQVGCPIGCPFCATGQAGFVRNLTVGEILAQVLHFAREMKRRGEAMPLTNVVMMGMGEPLMKYDVTRAAIDALIDPERFGLGARRITISTAGLIPGIERLTREKLQINLAVSLHALDDDLRDVLVPINRKYPLADLIRACRAYVENTRRRITFEYALMDGINDQPEQARAVAQMLRGMLCHVNLIPLNPTSESPYRCTPFPRVKQFEGILREAGIPTTLRVEKGIEISAGCGQLRQERSDDKKQRPVSRTPFNRTSRF